MNPISGREGGKGGIGGVEGREAESIRGSKRGSEGVRRPRGWCGRGWRGTRLGTGREWRGMSQERSDMEGWAGGNVGRVEVEGKVEQGRSVEGRRETVR